MNTEDWVNRLASIPDWVARAVGGRSDAALHETPQGGAWSAADIFAHVRASDDIMAFRLFALLVRNHSPLPAYDERQWAAIAGYVDADFHSSLNVFALRRAEVVKVLRAIAKDDWQRVGVHETRSEVTLLHELMYQVEHEEEHCRELEMLYT